VIYRKDGLLRASNNYKLQPLCNILVIFMTYITSKATRLPQIHLIVLMGSLLHCAPAYAYLDPGTGSMILQGIIAGLALAGVTLRHYWYRIMSFFGKGKPQANLLEDDSEHEVGSEK